LRKVENALDDADLVAQLMTLRLAVILCHARRDPDLTGMTLLRSDADVNLLQLKVRAGWAATYPQSAHLLREESLAWQKTPWSLRVEGV
jgi:exopolyphosphatase/guanosine-5'-triphosphate,3'-diphosphate pyrophosphatase